ncbi:MAG: orotidine-5'-phosphate decarboxylase [Oscillospiraceae bacterium]|jgi:orotidine-5'-phosphate decarboxylase|nr:orotidine-5'-phosphate decarboxylase [Oscillospiraceae bacterium]
MSFDTLQKRIDELQNPTVVGLDPAPELIPPRLLASSGSLAEATMRFNCELIDALRGIVPAVKPQSAFYEALGPAGMGVLRDTAEYANKCGLYVIFDGKRGDIGSTAAAYAEAYLGKSSEYAFDAMTVNGYLGSDGILPFLSAATETGKAVFALIKTSNPSSGELQDLECGGERIYEKLGGILERLAGDDTDEYGYSRLGGVVGATYPAELRALRQKLPHTFFLVPGYGAQGGGAGDVAGAFDKNGRGAIINSSRAIIGAWKKMGGDGSDFAEAARNEALRMRLELRREILL